MTAPPLAPALRHGLQTRAATMTIAAAMANTSMLHLPRAHFGLARWRERR